MAVVCDDRKEQTTYFGLMNRGITDIEVKRLGYADTLLDSGYAVERKGHDVIGSITRRTIWEQLSGLCQYEHPILCIVNENIWRDMYYCNNRWIDKAYRGFLTTLTVSYPKLKVFHFSCMEDYLDYLVSLDKKIHKEGTSVRPVPMVRRTKKPEEIKENVLSMIPGVSVGKAKKILECFGTVKNVANSNEKELQMVDGIGKKLAEEIYKILVK